MTLTCKALKNPLARKLCTALGAARVDVGQTMTSYAAKGSAPSVVGAKDNKLFASEVFRAALTVPATASGAFKRNALFKQSTGYSIPWIPNTTNREKIERELAATRTTLAQVGMTAAHPRYQEYVARNIDHLIRSILNITYVDHHKDEASIDGIIRRKYARCSEYATLFYGIALLAGIKTYPVEVYQGLNPHMAIAVEIKPGAYLYFDGQLGMMKRPIYKHYYLGGATDLFASFLYNKSARSNAAKTPRQSKNDPIELAAVVAPHNALIRFDLGNYYQGKKRWRLAMKHYGAACKLRSSYTLAYQRHCFMRIMTGMKSCKPTRR